MLNLYIPNFEEGVVDDYEKFLTIYNTIYDYLNRDFALENEIRKLLNSNKKEFTPEDIAKIVYWKVGGVDRSNLNKPMYGIRWKIEYQYGEIDVLDVYHAVKKVLNIAKDDDDLILRGILTECLKGEEYQDYKIENENVITSGIRHMGPVYAITLAYFMTHGRLPIYDKFAHIALLAINGKGMNDHFKKPFEYFYTKESLEKVSPAECTNINKIIERYNIYKEMAYDLYKEFGRENDKDRTIDRALWVYGHLFSDAKSNIAFNKTAIKNVDI